MGYSKKFKCSYHFLEAADDEYFKKLQESFDKIIKSGNNSGTFDAGKNSFFWKINGTEDITDTSTYFISLVKERNSWPVWFNSESNEVGEIPLTDGLLGELFYAFINPEHKFMLSVSALTGSAGENFKKLLNEFSLDGGVKITPLYEENINKTVLLWDFYKKVAFSLVFPTHDDITEFLTTKEGSKLALFGSLGGLKLDVTIAAPKQKQVLDPAEVRSLIEYMLEQEFCKKLVVRGADFDTEALQEHDLLNAQIKYSETVDIIRTFMSPDDAKNVLKRAFDIRAQMLLGN